ncbi:MAG: hypothetical protein H6581_07535 [Bacteroidia bacterium]|nr:hypothetical protein [Bacteroidia bacterium]
MKKIAASFVMILALAQICFAQDQINERVTEVTTVIEEQFPQLEKFAEQLGKHRVELEERAIVLKYHKGNKEVTEATNSAIRRIEEYNNGGNAKISEFESVWYDQMDNVLKIYTRYGEMRESSGGGATDLDAFVKRHREYMDLMTAVQQDLSFIAADCAYLRQ